MIKVRKHKAVSRFFENFMNEMPSHSEQAGEQRLWKTKKPSDLHQMAFG